MKPIKTKAWALANGYAYHGRLHGVPVWMTEPDGDLLGPIICPKNWLFGIALDVGEAVFATLVHFGLRDPVYAIELRAKIGDE